jgi:UDP-N-acetylmuramyl pentapeptide synthase
MGETGIFSEFLHGKFFEALIDANFDFVILIGKQMLHLYKKLMQNKKEILYFESLDEVLKKIKEIFLPLDLILIKGSNGLCLWKIIDFFKNKD